MHSTLFYIATPARLTHDMEQVVDALSHIGHGKDAAGIGYI